MRILRKAVLLEYLELTEKHPGRATVYYQENHEEIEHLWTWGMRNIPRWRRGNNVLSWKAILKEDTK